MSWTSWSPTLLVGWKCKRMYTQSVSRSIFMHFSNCSFTRSKLFGSISIIQSLTYQCILSVNNTWHCQSSRRQCSSNLFFNKNPPSFLSPFESSDRPAIADSYGLHTFQNLFKKANFIANDVEYLLSLKRPQESCDLRKKTFCCLLCPNDSRYLVSLWAAWLSGCVAVPLSGKHPTEMLKYFLDDSKSQVLLYTDEFKEVVGKLSKDRPSLATLLVQQQDDNVIDDNDSKMANRKDRWLKLKEDDDLNENPALVVYTSGTTGRPKGVLHTYGTLQAMIQGMVEEWGWTSQDVIIHALPLNHVHGIINALLTPLACGALCVMIPKFDSAKVWQLILEPGKSLPRRPSIFMGVPTMYSMLITSSEKQFIDQQLHSSASGNVIRSMSGLKQDECYDCVRVNGLSKDVVKKVCLQEIRLFVSGSAPLPLPVMEKWEELTGHRLLERYGMTEVGMALTNPLKGKRIPGAVGHPFPFVEVGLAKQNSQSKTGYDILVRADSSSTYILENPEDGAELFVRGSCIFKEYLNKPGSTADAFTSDGWFKTGDTARYDKAENTFRIMGRTSMDIIKCGGYKMSALEIENQLARHSAIAEVAVLGLPDHVWGQRVAALLVLKNCNKTGGKSNGEHPNGKGDSNGENGENRKGDDFCVESFKQWCSQWMPSYQVPGVFKVVSALKRNAMGKLNKKELLEEHFSSED